MLVFDAILKKHLEAFDMYPFTDRANCLRTRLLFHGRVAIDLFTCDKLLLPKTKFRIKRIRVRRNFYMLSDNSNVRSKKLDCSLFIGRSLIVEPNHRYLQWNLENEFPRYNYMETIARTLSIHLAKSSLFGEIFSNKLQ